jgi:protein TonB
MTVRSFPTPDARAAARASGRRIAHPIDRHRRGDFHWPPTDEEIDLVEVIDLGSQGPPSSTRFVALLGAPTEPAFPRLRLAACDRTAPAWRPPRRRPRLWPLAAGLIALHFVESRSMPGANQAPPSILPAVAATAHVSPPALTSTTPVPAAPIASPRARRAALPAPRRQARAVRAGHADTMEESFTPPRVAVQQPMPRLPAPFPAARASRSRIQVMVDARGRVESARLRSAGSSYYDERALEAVKAWRFEPAQRSGQPVRAALDVDVGWR